jgi:hypothetical protein
MLKPGLGKGLGDLMQGDRVAGTKPAPSETPAAQPGLGRGLNTLIQAETPPPRRRSILPGWFYFTADLLLLAYAVAITFDAPRPFDFGTLIFCAASIALGGTLGIVGILQTVASSADSHRNDTRDV